MFTAALAEECRTAPFPVLAVEVDTTRHDFALRLRVTASGRGEYCVAQRVVTDLELSSMRKDVLSTHVRFVARELVLTLAREVEASWGRAERPSASISTIE